MTGTLSPILVTNRADNYSNHHMLEGLHEGFKALGYKSQLHLIGQDGTGLDAFLEALPDPTSEQGQNSFLVDLNARMRLPQTHPLKKFSFITDHPFALLEQILASPQEQYWGMLIAAMLLFLTPCSFRIAGHSSPTAALNRILISTRLSTVRSTPYSLDGSITLPALPTYKRV